MSISQEELLRRVREIAQGENIRNRVTGFRCPFHGELDLVAVIGEETPSIVKCVHELPTCTEYVELDIPDYVAAVRANLQLGVKAN